jgi:hypothetical protein
VHGGTLSFERYVRMNRWEFSHAVVKEPNLTLLCPQLAEAFPGSPVIFIMRDPREHIRSLLNNLRIAGDHAALPPAYSDGRRSKFPHHHAAKPTRGASNSRGT